MGNHFLNSNDNINTQTFFFNCTKCGLYFPKLLIDFPNIKILCTCNKKNFTIQSISKYLASIKKENFTTQESPSTLSLCYLHKKEKSFFCLTCQSDICIKCKLNDHKYCQILSLSEYCSKKFDKITFKTKEDVISALNTIQRDLFAGLIELFFIGLNIYNSGVRNLNLIDFITQCDEILKKTINIEKKSSRKEETSLASKTHNKRFYNIKFQNKFYKVKTSFSPSNNNYDIDTVTIANFGEENFFISGISSKGIKEYFLAQLNKNHQFLVLKKETSSIKSIVILENKNNQKLLIYLTSRMIYQYEIFSSDKALKIKLLEETENKRKFICLYYLDKTSFLMCSTEEIAKYSLDQKGILKSFQSSVIVDSIVRLDRISCFSFIAPGEGANVVSKDTCEKVPYSPIPIEKNTITICNYQQGDESDILISFAPYNGEIWHLSEEGYYLIKKFSLDFGIEKTFYHQKSDKIIVKTGKDCFAFLCCKYDNEYFSLSTPVFFHFSAEGESEFCKNDLHIIKYDDFDNAYFYSKKKIYSIYK